MAKRITIYVDNETAHKLDEYDNKSKVIKEALNTHFLNKDYFISKKKKIERNIKEIKYQLEQENHDLQILEKQIKRIEKKEHERPKNYNKAVSTLKSLPDVNEEDLRFQAKRLNIDASKLKGWLWLDGDYEEIFRK